MIPCFTKIKITTMVEDVLAGTGSSPGQALGLSSLGSSQRALLCTEPSYRAKKGWAASHPAIANSCTHIAWLPVFFPRFFNEKMLFPWELGGGVDFRGSAPNRALWKGNFDSKRRRDIKSDQQICILSFVYLFCVCMCTHHSMGMEVRG